MKSNAHQPRQTLIELQLTSTLPKQTVQLKAFRANRCLSETRVCGNAFVNGFVRVCFVIFTRVCITVLLVFPNNTQNRACLDLLKARMNIRASLRPRIECLGASKNLYLAEYRKPFPSFCFVLFSQLNLLMNSQNIAARARRSLDNIS